MKFVREPVPDAGTSITNCVPFVIEAIVAFTGIFAPETTIPTIKSAVLGTFTVVELFVVLTPDTIAPPLLKIWDKVTFAGKPVCPGSNPYPVGIPSKLDTATSVFPEIIRTPVNVRRGASKVTVGAVEYREPPATVTDFNEPTVTFAKAFAGEVTTNCVALETAAIVEPAGIPVPLTAIPAAKPVVLVTVTVDNAPPPMMLIVGADWYPVPGKSTFNPEMAPPVDVVALKRPALTGFPPVKVTTGLIVAE